MVFGNIFANALAPIDDLQLKLSEEFIEPNVQKFELAFYSFREALDELWLIGQSDKLPSANRTFLLEEIEKQKRKITVASSREYPLGRCYNITAIAYAYIQQFEIRNPRSPFYVLNEFVCRGGVFKVIWGEVRHEVFQTSMQIGNWYFDTANDTVILTKPKVLSFTFNSSKNEFHEIWSMKHYIEIKERYHECTVYLNNVFPSISSLFPLISLSKNNLIEVVNSQHICDLMAYCKYSYLGENDLPQLSKAKQFQVKSVFKNAAVPQAFKKYVFSDEVFTPQFILSNFEEVKKVVRFVNFILQTSKS